MSRVDTDACSFFPQGVQKVTHCSPKHTWFFFGKAKSRPIFKQSSIVALAWPKRRCFFLPRLMNKILCVMPFVLVWWLGHLFAKALYSGRWMDALRNHPAKRLRTMPPHKEPPIDYTAKAQPASSAPCCPPPTVDAFGSLSLFAPCPWSPCVFGLFVDPKRTHRIAGLLDALLCGVCGV